ncbi:MAG: DUF2281 domain-containing protein [Gammaproteobacteria bacterium]|nr:DUF2281 domain-containing protein [Gammaproteobacteria bacterium]
MKESENLPTRLQEEVLDFVHFLQQKQARKIEKQQDNEEPNGAKLARLMERVAKRGTAFSSIKDPVAWQRNVRKDRPLPGRE